jgi:hypothetical protein
MVYLGAPNIGQYAPAIKSFVNGADFVDAEDLAQYLIKVRPLSS